MFDLKHVALSSKHENKNTRYQQHTERQSDNQHFNTVAHTRLLETTKCCQYF